MWLFGEFNPTLEDVMRLTMLPLFGEANDVAIVLEENDQVKLKHLTATMAASRTFGKSNLCD